MLLNQKWKTKNNKKQNKTKTKQNKLNLYKCEHCRRKLSQSVSYTIIFFECSNLTCCSTHMALCFANLIFVSIKKELTNKKNEERHHLICVLLKDFRRKYLYESLSNIYYPGEIYFLSLWHSKRVKGVILKCKDIYIYIYDREIDR